MNVSLLFERSLSFLATVILGLVFQTFESSATPISVPLDQFTVQFFNGGYNYVYSKDNFTVMIPRGEVTSVSAGSIVISTYSNYIWRMGVFTTAPASGSLIVNYSVQGLDKLNNMLVIKMVLLAI